MKKLITVLAVCVLLSVLLASAAVPASAKKYDSFSYLSMTLARELAGQDQYVCWVIPWDSIFEDGKTYTLYANAMFENIEPNGGCAYINMYAYDSLEAAMTTDWDHLVQFKDYAKYPSDDGSVQLGEWADFEFTGDFSEVQYPGFKGPKTGTKATLEAVWISIGFYLSTGTINVRELGVKDDTGAIIYCQTFENGLDFSEPYFRHTDDIVPETEGETWSILKTEDKKEESSEEPEPVAESSEEPEPVAESSEEPEPVAESSEEPEPVAESTDEPAPVGSTDEPAPAESTDEPAPVESTDEPAPAESTESEAPAASNGSAPWIWIVGAVAVAAVLAVVLILILKKKKS